MKAWRSGLGVAVAGIAALVALGRSPPAHAVATSGRYVVDAKLETLLDNATKLTWQRAQAVGTYSWSAAQEACKDLKLAGGGWRVPTLVELEGIVDRGHKDPAIDTLIFGPTTPDQFWTAASALSVGQGWAVHFGAGNSVSVSKTSLLRVRCVR